jgi:hypothetical protein
MSSNEAGIDTVTDPQARAAADRPNLTRPSDLVCKDHV